MTFRRWASCSLTIRSGSTRRGGWRGKGPGTCVSGPRRLLVRVTWLLSLRLAASPPSLNLPGGSGPAEPESPALRRWLDERAETEWISSVLTEIESFRALAWYAAEAASRLPAVLDQIDLIDLGPGIRILARTVEPVTVRSLDAIHLATALHYRSGLTSFVTYDKRLSDAAQAAALPVDSPA
jgi:uncharacterized protein